MRFDLSKTSLGAPLLTQSTPSWLIPGKTFRCEGGDFTLSHVLWHDSKYAVAVTVCDKKIGLAYRPDIGLWNVEPA